MYNWLQQSKTSMISHKKLTNQREVVKWKTKNEAEI